MSSGSSFLGSRRRVPHHRDVSQGLQCESPGSDASSAVWTTVDSEPYFKYIIAQDEYSDTLALAQRAHLKANGSPSLTAPAQILVDSNLTSFGPAGLGLASDCSLTRVNQTLPPSPTAGDQTWSLHFLPLSQSPTQP